MTILTSQNQTTTVYIERSGYNSSTNSWEIAYTLTIETVIPSAVISVQSITMDLPDVQTFLDSWTTIQGLVDSSIQRAITNSNIVEWQEPIESDPSESAWVIGQTVSIGAIRTYNGVTYTCKQLHVTQSSWTPDLTPALWSVYNPPLSAWVQPLGAQDSYQIGDRVTHNGNTWESTANNNVWEPGVFGWVIV